MAFFAWIGRTRSYAAQFTAMRGVRAAVTLYVVAGVTLVSNDWWLKGAGILPGWLTGKLSDFAGLVLAIITAALVLGHRRSRISLLACVSIVSVFALVKLSPSSARVFVAALSSAGLAWRLVPDPTDLVALSVVPFAWTAARTLTQRVQRVGLTRLALRASAIPAAVACLASGVTDDFAATGYVYNDSGETLFVEISSVPWLTCDQVDQFGADWLERSDFESIGLFRVGPREVVPLDGDGTSNDSGDCNCLFRVSFEGKSVVVRPPNNNVHLKKSPERGEVHNARPQLVLLRPGEAPLPGSRLEVLEIPVTAEANSCAEEPSPMTFSARVTDLANARILAIESVAGECWELELASDEPPSTSGGLGGAAGAAGEISGGAAGAAGVGGAGSDAGEPPNGIRTDRLDVCAPRELFPFGVGDVVTFSLRTVHDYYRGLTHQLEIIEPTGARGFRLELGAPRDGFVPAVEPDTSCGPRRDSERQPWLPLRATIDPGVGPGLVASALLPGQRHDVALADGKRATVYLGRARHFLNASGCAQNWQNPPPESWIEVAESWSP